MGNWKLLEIEGKWEIHIYGGSWRNSEDEPRRFPTAWDALKAWKKNKKGRETKTIIFPLALPPSEERQPQAQLAPITAREFNVMREIDARTFSNLWHSSVVNYPVIQGEPITFFEDHYYTDLTHDPESPQEAV